MSDVLSALETYATTVNDHIELDHIKKTVQFIRTHPRAFHRDHDTGGHIGASAVVINPTTHQILLTRHTIMNIWTFFGNHCDGNMDLVNIARARITKDAGATYGTTATTDGQIFDVDIHNVPPHDRHGDIVPAHLHYDIAYIFKTELTETPNDQAQWVPLNNAATLNPADPQFNRIIGKLCKTTLFQVT